jgi:NAD-dependent deacetylase
MGDIQQKIIQAAELLRSARTVVALTGAGISTPSGIPDFRSAESGLWTDSNAMQAVSLHGFKKNPQVFYDWIRPLARLIIEAQPNAAHYALADLEDAGIIKAVITQNIDMLHSRAGSRSVFEIHGHLREATCMECAVQVATKGLLEAFVQSGVLPRCEKCRGVLKPNVVLFGEEMPRQTLLDAQHAASTCDVLLIAGSSLAIAPAADLPLLALHRGAQLMIINYEPTYIDADAEFVIRDNVASVLPELMRQVEGAKE